MIGKIVVTQNGNSVSAEGGLDDELMTLLRYRQVARATRNYEIADQIKAKFPGYDFADHREGFKMSLKR